ncbi:diguanylate cyclase [Methylobacterium sp. Leaf399]|uniref:putative bifunctional diguanylate cyclase/phosphodiesterase n=1 Tax=unclassified Methylobacterium TaxID=2615210 RepID=UPI00070120C0|nr:MULTISPECIES: EAL domain-containing protein [unclassified Methylobacterium]KQP51759.1 diguanylate cyclase [Methylobacterium sp. Leaf108]KQT14822.1 diguanylate cyclase [Methylobacterium sp. Leaf399]KQT90488.1 diguanylate cyclase [Methylobacterium sp. Leaf466]
MSDDRSASWAEGEARELLSLMMIGVCVWIVGTQLGVFKILLEFTALHGLEHLLMLAICMSLGIGVAAVRKSFKLRRVMEARDGAQAQAESVARHDVLTGLANRRLFKETLDARLASAEGIPSIAVIQIDLDRFKPVNDVHGHAAGDAVLCAVADRLRGLLPPGNTAARLGGDEFALLFDYGADTESVSRLAQQIITSLSQPIPWGAGRLEIGATIGIALASVETVTSETLLHAADVAMYQGKRDGRSTYRFFQLEMGHALKIRALLEQDLRAGIARGEIEPFYQPVVALPGRELIGFEVLARWRHPEHGLMNPSDFITLAEETGMIADLCWSLMRQACRDARSWPQHLQLAINISPLQLQDKQMPERVLAILTETGFAPSRLEIEITETALVNDLEAARVALKSLQNLGVRIALDDFGTGYSSLYHLRELQFDKLKIDRSYVASIPLGSERAKLVDAIIALGSSLGLLTTAEGIETASSVDWLADQGCTYGQGFLFGAPMGKSATDVLLAEWSDESGKVVLDGAAEAQRQLKAGALRASAA